MERLSVEDVGHLPRAFENLAFLQNWPRIQFIIMPRRRIVFMPCQEEEKQYISIQDNVNEILNITMYVKLTAKIHNKKPVGITGKKTFVTRSTH